MDVSDIKDLLHAYRPGEETTGDVEKARRIAENDPELKEWMANEAAFDKAFAARLSEVEPPSDLLEKILAAKDAGKDNVIAFPQRGAEPAHSRWNGYTRYAISMAASFLIIAGIMFFMRGPASASSDDLETFVDATVENALSNSVSMQKAQTLGDVIKGLQAAYAPVPGDLPEDLAHFQPASYGVLHTQQGNIGQIGFSGDDSYRLMVLERRCLGGCSSKLTKPIVFDLGDNLAVTWAKGSQVYILVSDRDDERLIRNVAANPYTSL
jgi:hypothetical protein